MSEKPRKSKSKPKAAGAAGAGGGNEPAGPMNVGFLQQLVNLMSANDLNTVANYTFAYTAYAIKCVVSPGIPNNEGFAIGDSLCSGKPIRFLSLPRFQPEHFALLRNTDRPDAG